MARNNIFDRIAGMDKNLAEMPQETNRSLAQAEQMMQAQQQRQAQQQQQMQGYAKEGAKMGYGPAKKFVSGIFNAAPSAATTEAVAGSNLSIMSPSATVTPAASGFSLTGAGPSATAGLSVAGEGGATLGAGTGAGLGATALGVGALGAGAYGAELENDFLGQGLESLGLGDAGSKTVKAAKYALNAPLELSKNIWDGLKSIF